MEQDHKAGRLAGEGGCYVTGMKSSLPRFVEIWKEEVVNQKEAVSGGE